MKVTFKVYQNLLFFALLGFSQFGECDSDKYFLPDLPPLISGLNENFLPNSECGKIEIQNDFPLKLKKILIDDLNLMANIQGSLGSLLHQMDFGSGKVSGEEYCAYLHKRIYSFEYGGSGDELDVASNNHLGVVKLTDFYFSLPAVIRLSTLIHEARHTLKIKGGQYGHYSCPNPYKDENGFSVIGIVTGRSIAGYPICDWTVDGPYGIEITWLMNIAERCQNCSSNFKINARRGADVAFVSIASLYARKELRRDFNTTSAR